MIRPLARLGYCKANGRLLLYACCTQPKSHKMVPTSMLTDRFPQNNNKKRERLHPNPQLPRKKKHHTHILSHIRTNHVRNARRGRKTLGRCYCCACCKTKQHGDMGSTSIKYSHPAQTIAPQGRERPRACSKQQHTTPRPKNPHPSHKMHLPYNRSRLTRHTRSCTLEPGRSSKRPRVQKNASTELQWNT